MCDGDKSGSDGNSCYDVSINYGYDDNIYDNICDNNTSGYGCRVMVIMKVVMMKKWKNDGYNNGYFVSKMVYVN